MPTLAVAIIYLAFGAWVIVPMSRTDFVGCIMVWVLSSIIAILIILLLLPRSQKGHG